MAREVPSSEFPPLLDSLSDKITWSMINPILKFEISGLNGGTLINVYEYQENSDLFYLVLKYHKFEKLMVVANTNKEDGEFEARAMRAVIPLFFGKLQEESIFECVLPGASNQELSRFLRDEEKSHPYTLMEVPTYNYIIDEEDEKVLFSKKIELAPEFEMRQLEAYHAKQMMSVMLHYQDGDEDQAAIRLSEFPSIGIFEKSTNKLVGFEYNDGLGLIAHQYVYPEYRGLGFGRAVEITICRKNIEDLGIRPAKCVAILRPKARAFTERAGFWKKKPDAYGNPGLVWWTLHSKLDKEKVQIFDN
ncbi:hypothetical protein FO519_008897 [Halicephalobus sp. NKZ332]|nr:hypothetical protein FO519_008897 [Halicephalobus sp. NKZ332]